MLKKYEVFLFLYKFIFILINSLEQVDVYWLYKCIAM